ncbi:Cys-every-fifth radical SAM/SPASM peptide maturase CefB [Peptoniphilus harei]|uniref:Cys-every-fifth radical SAM/SPASM peptide maturase CefB n=1 Tax=Peptoniphilus harei TaxID=54005 RepID=UPI002901809D|nr:Cys-every-fifth radical SAM/SPASM peptide maturase CefB [Peptoniphilus harei]MDU1643150.1 Cys-every-fifth radical SAM/SPASM peptide maturase CefB [Peptoniphilus harei]
MKYSNYNLIIKVSDNKNIVFNTLSGEAFLVEDRLANFVESGIIDKLTDEEIEKFSNKKIIIDDEFDEKYMYNYIRNKVIYQNNHLTYTILLTWACNLRCIYCYEGAGEDRNDFMTRSTSEKIILSIKKEIENRNSKSITIFLFGGEPLVNYKEGKYILEKLNDFCKERGTILNTAIITNGILLSEEIIRDLIHFNCKYIQITLDGTKNIHDMRRIRKNGSGTFDEIISKLHLLKKYEKKLNVVIRVNIDKINYKEVPKLLEYLKKEGLDSFSIDFGVVRSSTESCNDYEDNCISDSNLGQVMSELWDLNSKVESNILTYPMRKWTYCGLDCDNNFTIDPTGNVYKCWEHVGNEKHLMGAISENGDITGLNPKFYKWMTQSPVDSDFCGNCVYLPACGGGCRSISFDKNVDFDSSQCFKIKGVLEEEIKLFFKDKI